MILYLVYDRKKKKVSHPMVGPSTNEVLKSLAEMRPRPENYDDLTIYTLIELSCTSDLFKLDVNENAVLPSFLTEEPSL